MVKKLIIEKDDEQKMLDWDEERIKGFREKYHELDSDEGTYVIGLDIATKDSLDKSMMCSFKITGGQYGFVGADEI